MKEEEIEKTEIEGLFFQKNLYTCSPDEKYSHVIASDGPGISDMVTHSNQFSYQHYGIHIAQVDRLTFFGDRTQKIIGHFVDCRKDSPTLHKKVVLEYYPDPKKMLYIDRGIAHTFDGLENVLTRDEPIWYLSTGNIHYNMANDVVNVDRNESIENFPILEVNKYPIPKQAYEYALKVQQHNMKDLQEFPHRFQIQLDGEMRYVNLKPKKRSEV
ncbi:dTDP-4-dehydrorhamnose 3,5-epimerase family protein [Bacillus siamensis]|uniref:dTDP-4-dehydrorhamnose 3,5-epimerase family protein n=1 Tax=Bacillus siamensis TaxID=659243 RepID=UPI002E1D3308|nr:dTDP-4-dehydrorhamnose 3,5-epimerase family protein [Bacillus siamensis]MED5049221.1 dTDP-4-dehydrorhamnose 3,5-epimerase family protein [Bacillus siamensis]MED5097526.1 dTDP-4-dehydrorhamnose 3,5-epimerase family protein [Bacillus siamensis]